MNNSLILKIMIRILGHFSKHIDANQTDLFIILSDWFSEFILIGIMTISVLFREEILILFANQTD